jgi:predicted phosphodiesterase
VRYAIVSDIHANLQAWNAVLTDIASQKVDKILCLGDLVGYGPDPSEVLSSLYRHVDGFCIGNHDAVICGKLDAGLFNDHAREMIEWTRSQLSDKAVRFLSNLPLTLSAPGFRCTHGDFTDPAAFQYIIDSESAAPSWKTTQEPLLFYGHTHVPAFFVIGNSGKTHELEPQAFILEPGKRYLVNPGSVGNPRNGGTLASYCTFDSSTGTVRWHKVSFDLDAYRNAIRNAGLNESDTQFLSHDPRQNLHVVREDVNFSPARTEAEKAQGFTAAQELEKLSKTARRWKRATISSLAVALVGISAAIGYGVLRPPQSESVTIPLEPLVETMPAAIDGNWLPPFPKKMDGYAIAGWRMTLDNPKRIEMHIDADTSDTTALTIAVQDNTPARFRIESPPIRVRRSGPERYTLRSQLQRPDSFRGYVRYAVEQLGTLKSGAYPVLRRETKDPPPISSRIQFTTDETKIVPEAKYVRLVIEGEFLGEVIIESPSLEPKT